MLENILALDRALFLKINRDWTNSFLDQVMPICRDAKTWVPLYLLIVGWAFYKFGYKIWTWLVTIGLMMLTSDQLSSHLIKPFFARPRPCNDLIIHSEVRLLLQHCTESFSFTSSHAVNHFCIAMFLVVTLQTYFKKWIHILWLWAFSICYGQVYVGVHFPLDVTVGAILGCVLGYGFAKVFLNKIGLPQPVLRFKDSK